MANFGHYSGFFELCSALHWTGSLWDFNEQGLTSAANVSCPLHFLGPQPGYRQHSAVAHHPTSLQVLHPVEKKARCTTVERPPFQFHLTHHFNFRTTPKVWDVGLCHPAFSGFIQLLKAWQERAVPFWASLCPLHRKPPLPLPGPPRMACRKRDAANSQLSDLQEGNVIVTDQYSHPSARLPNPLLPPHNQTSFLRICRPSPAGGGG